MNIFLLGRINETWYDEYLGKVIVAENEAQAREMANDDVGDEGKVWTDATEVSCIEIDMSKSAVILQSFHAG